MSRASKRTVTRWGAALLVTAGAVGTLGYVVLHGGSPAGAVPSEPAFSEPVVHHGADRPAAVPLSPAELRARADYVSEDGSYVRFGEVEISAVSVVRAAPPG